MSTRFGIEWAYGEFRVGRFVYGDCVQWWRSPEPVVDLESLNWAMTQAREHVDMSRGGTVAIAYEDDKHTHEFLEVPPLSKRELEKYLGRRVEQDKMFDGDAAWCYHEARRGVGKDGILLHLMPKDIVDAVIRICEEHYLVPKRLVPLTEVVSAYVPSLEENPDDIVILVAPFRSRVELVVSYGNGDILFVRELAYDWHEQAERLVMDINRTVGYCKQRIGGAPGQLWVIGEGGKDLEAILQGRFDMPVKSDELSENPDFWMTQVASLSQRLSSNFIPQLARRAVNRKSITRAAVLACFAVLVCSIFIVTGVEFFVSSHVVDTDEIEDEISNFEVEIQELETNIQQAATYKERLDSLSADAFNLPALFLSHLGDLVPSGLVLNEAQVTRTGPAWEIRLIGISNMALDDMAGILEQLQGNLAGEPWNVHIIQGWEQSWMKQLEAGSATSEDAIGFEIVGQVR